MYHGESMRHEADVAIVGAGPAGAWCAWRLAREGARVLLLDPSHPREKPCGGGVTGRALSLVAPALEHAPPCVRIRQARFVDSRSRSESSVKLASEGRDLVVASRAAFDGALLVAAERAGATFVAARVADVERAAAGFAIRTTCGRRFGASLLIGADGANSLVRRRMSRAFSRAQLSIATGYFVHGVSSDEVTIELVGDPAGYIWSFPRPDHLAIGICAQADTGWTAEALRALVHDWIERTRVAPRGARTQPYSWPIPSLTPSALRRLQLNGRGWMLIGDAAGLVDPITREGIFYALLSADLAATAIASALPAPDAAYASSVRREIAPELARAARLKAGFFRPQFTRLLVHALASSPRVAGIMGDLIAGTQTYAGLKWRLLTTLEWKLAWQMIRLDRGRVPERGYLAR